ncbi:MAG TPA: cytochrome c [Rhizomicrobium sp.]|nr:cytochrome c [Rhizomicrobium sp.]
MALNVAVCALVWLRSEAVIERRYPLPSTTVAASTDQKMIARGAHLIAIAGCSDCHGANLEGRLTRPASLLPVWSSNLRIAAHTLTDEEFERAIRTGILPDSKSMWVMPAMDYAYMSEDDVIAIVSYLRTLKALGTAKPAPSFDMPARFAIARSDLEPVALVAPESPTSLDLGPRYDGGRYLARIACADCHDTDLTGSADAPDLSVVARYNRGDFFRLLKSGITSDGRRLESKSRPRFRAFHDYEIDALYDYLSARAKALSRNRR